MRERDFSDELQGQVQAAMADGAPVHITGGNTKAFYGRNVAEGCRPLPVAGHVGVVAYEPTELAISLRAGTPLAEVNRLLEEQGQQLPFEPPAFGEAATIGGAVAAGLSGPRRPFAGAVRDAVLGVKLINGRGETLNFGGRVMKNVAGYDVSRLMAGSLGTLGVLLEVSLKVRPVPPRKLTLVHELDAPAALARMQEWEHMPLAITALCHDGERLYARVCGGDRSLEVTREAMGGEVLEEAPAFWGDLREQRLPFFASPGPLWRLSVPPAAALMDLPGEWLLEWGGALRWLKSDADPGVIRAAAAAAGGHATLFRGHDGSGEVFQPLPAPLLALHRNLKRALDPQSLFNPGRMYAEL